MFIEKKMFLNKNAIKLQLYTNWRGHEILNQHLDFAFMSIWSKNWKKKYDLSTKFNKLYNNFYSTLSSIKTVVHSMQHLLGIFTRMLLSTENLILVMYEKLADHSLFWCLVTSFNLKFKFHISRLDIQRNRIWNLFYYCKFWLL